MMTGSLKNWLLNVWTGQQRTRMSPIPSAEYDAEQLKHLIDNADLNDPRALEEIAARLGQTDPSSN